MMTYRRDAEIYMLYARLTKEDSSNFDRQKALEIFEKKNATVSIAWIVSHCRTDSKQEVLVEKLSKHVPIDIYGECGPLNYETPRSKSAGSDCRKQLTEKYKFYLAFENCLCGEYVTEKFFDVLSTDMVPIVYSGPNYTELGVPPGSYINVADFKSVEELAERILWLAEHADEYLGYLEARAGIMAAVDWPATWCQICEKLTSESGSQQPQKLYEDVDKWLNRWPSGEGSRPSCVPPPDFVTRS